MFYSQFILAKKGPLGTIWIAAHLEGKLRKNHVTDTNISASVDSILFPEVPIALRLSGHLLLGVVRIYSRKVNYLFHDCSEALVKIKHAFHCSSVDLPPEASKVPFHSITLPETFNFDALEASFKWDKLHASSGDYLVDHHVSARDLITLQDQTNEETQRSLFQSDERFPGSSDPYSLLNESDEEHAQEHSRASSLKVSILQENEGSVLEEDVLPPLQVDEEMDIERENINFMQQTEQSGTSSRQLFDVDLPSSSQSDPTKKSANLESGSLSASRQMQDFPDIEKLRSIPEQTEPETFLMELEEELVPSSSKLKKTGISENAVDDLGHHEVEAMPVLDETPQLNRSSPSTIEDFGNYSGGDKDLLGNILEGRTPVFKVASTSKEAPESAQGRQGLKKRKAVFDDKIVLSSFSMKKQIAGAADLLRKRRKMPLTQFGALRMQGIRNGQMFGRPSFPGLSSPVRELYSRITMLSAKEQSNCPPTPHQGVEHPCINEGVLSANRMAEVETLLADNYPVDGSEAPSFSPLQSPHNMQQTHNVDVNCADKQGIESGYSGSGTSEQENKGAQEPELGLCDTLPEEPDYGMAVEVDNRLFDKEVLEALATQASQNAVGVVTPPLSATTAGQVLEKLDFLEDNREKDIFHSDGDLDGYDHFVDERNTSHPRRAKDNQLDNGWSVRTKCVAKYLKSIFEEAEPPFGSQVSLDSLLKGRTKKEAARMYFETLVLKSKDYLHVQQRSGFAEIMLSATPLLRKDIL